MPPHTLDAAATADTIIYAAIHDADATILLLAPPRHYDTLITSRYAMRLLLLLLPLRKAIRCHTPAMLPLLTLPPCYFSADAAATP